MKTKPYKTWPKPPFERGGKTYRTLTKQLNKQVRAKSRILLARKQQDELVDENNILVSY